MIEEGINLKKKKKSKRYSVESPKFATENFCPNLVMLSEFSYMATPTYKID